MRNARTRILGLGALALAVAALTPPAHAASIAYIENGNVWLSSPDGAKKVQLTTNGTVDRPWLGIAQSATGVTAAAYSVPGTEGQARLVRFKLWDALGKEVLDSSLPSRQTPNLASAPLALEISDDGAWVAQEYSYCNGFGITYCQTISRGAWLGQTSIASVLDAVDLSSMRQATFFGRRMVSSDGSSIRVQNASGTIPGSSTVYDAPLVTDAADWIPPYGSGQHNMRADVPASGGKVAVEILVPGATPKNRVIVMSYSGEIGTSPPDEPNGCAMGGASVSGDAHSVAWSPDGTKIAWRDAQGLKVAGAPTLPWPSLEPCAFSSPAVLISGPPADPDAKDSTGVYLTTQGPSFGG
ncbi:MAG: hypothetical protein MUC84_02820, partial [Solirubrobacteraceae bacterium]|nr:hypothetical protein [Solirubrobacteraceae bacterium]